MNVVGQEAFLHQMPTTVAVLGSSLANVLVADKLRMLHGVRPVVFEPGSLGGAWGKAPLNGSDAPRFNNIVFPFEASLESQMTPLSRTLKNFGANVKVFRNNFAIRSEYQPKRIIAGDFSAAVLQSLPSGTEIRPEKARQVAVSTSGVMVNGDRFDFCIASRNLALATLTFESGASDTSQPTQFTIHPRTETNVSRHVRVSVGDLAWDELPVFSDFGDNVFDRCGLIRTSKVFIGRVRREFKAAKLSDLLEFSALISKRTRPTVFDEQLFPQTRIEEEDINLLKRASFGSRFWLLDSTDLLSAMRSADTYLESFF